VNLVKSIINENLDMEAISHPELRADSGLFSGRAHLQGLLIVSAAHLLKQIIDEIQSTHTHRESLTG